MEPYLQELVKKTPGSQQKLLAAWDGFDFETQVKILNKLNCEIPKELVKKILTSSTNDYIKYLAAKNIYLDEEKDQPLLKIIQSN